MVLLPVVERELQVAARGRAMYRVRFWSVLIMACIFGWAMESFSSYESMAAQGEDLLGMLTAAAFIFCILIGVVATSDCVSEEKREGTLGLLFLTDLRGYDVIIGKMAAKSLNAFYALVASLPILGIPLLMGGVTFLQFSKIALVLFSTMILSLSVGIFVSTFSRNDRKAMIFTFLFLAVLTFLPVIVAYMLSEVYRYIGNSEIWTLLMFTPGFGIVQAMVAGGALPATSYWYSVGWELLLALLLIALACEHVPKSWEEGVVKKAWRVKAPPLESRTPPRKGSNRQWLDRNPFVWLALQGEEPSRDRVWLLVGAVFGIWLLAAIKYGTSIAADPILVWLAFYIVNIPLELWILAEACRVFSENRSINAFELLLSTPLRLSQIIGGQWLALRQQFARPMAAVLCWEILVLVFATRHGGWRRTYYDDPRPPWPQILLFAMDSLALASAGMWFGLRLKGRIRAMMASILAVFVVPAGIAIADGIWVNQSGSRMGDEEWRNAMVLLTLARAFVIDPIIIVLTTSRLARQFRELAIRR